MKKTGIWCVDQNNDPHYRFVHTRLAAIASYQAEHWSEKAAANPTKQNHWEAFSYHNGAALKHDWNSWKFNKDYHKSKRDHHHERKLHHLAEWKKLP